MVRRSSNFIQRARRAQAIGRARRRRRVALSRTRETLRSRLIRQGVTSKEALARLTIQEALDRGTELTREELTQFTVAERKLIRAELKRQAIIKVQLARQKQQLQLAQERAAERKKASQEFREEFNVSITSGEIGLVKPTGEVVAKASEPSIATPSRVLSSGEPGFDTLPSQQVSNVPTQQTSNNVEDESPSVRDVTRQSQGTFTTEADIKKSSVGGFFFKGERSPFLPRVQQTIEGAKTRLFGQPDKIIEQETQFQGQFTPVGAGQVVSSSTRTIPTAKGTKTITQQEIIPEIGTATFTIKEQKIEEGTKLRRFADELIPSSGITLGETAALGLIASPLGKSKFLGLGKTPLSVATGKTAFRLTAFGGARVAGETTFKLTEPTLGRTGATASAAFTEFLLGRKTGTTGLLAAQPILTKPKQTLEFITQEPTVAAAGVAGGIAGAGVGRLTDPLSPRFQRFEFIAATKTGTQKQQALDFPKGERTLTSATPTLDPFLQPLQLQQQFKVKTPTSGLGKERSGFERRTGTSERGFFFTEGGQVSEAFFGSAKEGGLIVAREAITPFPPSITRRIAQGEQSSALRAAINIERTSQPGRIFPGQKTSAGRGRELEFVAPEETIFFRQRTDPLARGLGLIGRGERFTVSGLTGRKVQVAEFGLQPGQTSFPSLGKNLLKNIQEFNPLKELGSIGKETFTRPVVRGGRTTRRLGRAPRRTPLFRELERPVSRTTRTTRRQQPRQEQRTRTQPRGDRVIGRINDITRDITRRTTERTTTRTRLEPRTTTGTRELRLDERTTGFTTTTGLFPVEAQPPKKRVRKRKRKPKVARLFPSVAAQAFNIRTSPFASAAARRLGGSLGFEVRPLAFQKKKQSKRRRKRKR